MKSMLGNLVTCAVLILVIFLFDLNVPLGIGIGALYAFVIVLGSASESPRMIHFYTALCSVLLIFGAYIHQERLVPWSIVFINRSIYLALIWGTSALITRDQKSRQLLRERDSQLQRLNAQLEELVTQDHLTGLANRRRFDQELDRELRRCVRDLRPISLLMIDVDFFKRYNDHFGHQAGDECLARIAAAVKEQLHRPADVAARYGGEEFAVILPETERKDAEEIAEAIQSQVRELAIPHCKPLPGGIVTVSTGVATITPKNSAELSALVESADRALYEAKRAGRNQIVVAAIT
ncbi:MAG: GGDEF domain-containing protein [Methylococcaceae bacterium]|nr:GGDEF domain-containing protein [Methylococcaceae bacterium]